MRSSLNIVKHYHPEVMKVVDATEDAHFVVTKDDCKFSISRSPEHCALATSALRKWDGAIISLAVAYLVKGRTAYRYRVPTSIQREIVSFDRSHDFRPGTYRLTPYPKSQKMGKRQLFDKKHNRTYATLAARSHDRIRRRAHRTTGIRVLAGGTDSVRRKSLIL